MGSGKVRYKDSKHSLLFAKICLVSGVVGNLGLVFVGIFSLDRGGPGQTEENKEDYGFKAQLETYAFIDRIQHMKKDGIFDIKWIEPFKDIRENMEQIKLKWIYDQKKIFMTFMDDSIKFHVTQEEVKIYSEEEINSKKEEIKSEYLYDPIKETDEIKAIKDLIENFPFPRIKSIFEEGWQIYNECVELYSEKYGEYLISLNKYNQEMSKYCSLGFNLHNYAHFTLYDITAHISFPEGLEIQTEQILYG